MQRETIPPALRRVMIGSAVAHVVLLIAVWIGGSFTTRAAPARPNNFVTTKLVKLGKKRDEKLLPRISASTPPPPKKAVVPAPASPSKAPTPPKPDSRSSAKDRIKEISKVSSALDRLRRTAAVDEEGDPSGVEGGEVTDISKAILGNKYATEIYKCLKQNWNIQGVPESRVAGKQARVLVRVDADGRIRSFEIIEASALKAFNTAVERAVRGCGKISPPPEPLRDAVREGIEVVFKP